MPQNNNDYDHWMMDEDDEPVIDDLPETRAHYHTDEELESCVRELMRNSREDYSDVRVSVDARNVFFEGTIESEEARRHLEDMAKMIQGVGHIKNNVTLRH